MDDDGDQNQQQDPNYGPETRDFMLATGAQAVVTIVFGGVRGNGVSSRGRRRGAVVDPRAVGLMLRDLAERFGDAAEVDQDFDITITPRKRGGRQP
ncbi:hypothetical protein [Paraburkholderia youngii]|uniref:hypothetical protein n=1 Tax=Paraburkholderia youngii TaxID=2782701 RepID=UPI003D1F0353